MSNMANCVRSLLSWSIATMLVCGCVVGFYYFQRADEELRLRIERKLAELCPSHTVTVGSAHLVKGEGIRLRSVSIVKPATVGQHDRAELVFCDDVVVYGTPTLEQLLKGQLDVHRVRLGGLLLRLKRHRDGRWNFGDLVPANPSNQKIPTIVLENARVEVVDQLASSVNIVEFKDIQATISPADSASAGSLITVRGGFENEHIGQADIETQLDPKTLSWSMTGTLTGLKCDKQIWKLLPPDLKPTLPHLDGFQINADVGFSAAQGNEEAYPRFQVSGSLFDGRFDAPRFLENPITEISAGIVEVVNDGSRSGWRIDNIAARYGGCHLNISAQSPSLQLNGDIEIAGSAASLNLTRRLIDVLPEKPRGTWAKYQPLGLIDVPTFRLNRTAGQWWFGTDVQFRDVSLLCSKFKYPFVRSHGEVRFRQDQKLTVDLWASTDQLSNRTPVHITADIDRPGPNYMGYTKVKSDDWVPIDNRLTNALPAGVRKILNDMQARGEVNFDATMWRNEETGGRVAKDIAVTFRHGALRHRKFPYPLQDVEGRVHVRDTLWTFEDFVGKNDSCIVRASGKWAPHAIEDNGRAAGELDLGFEVSNIPCDEELRNALPAGPQKIWQSLRPTGHIDYAEIELFHRQSMSKPSIDFVVKQRPRKDDPHRRSLEMQPTWFPLRMNRVTGIVDYNHDGRFTLDKIKAEYGSDQRAVQFRSEGEGQFREDGTWEVNLSRILVDDMETSPELISALPKELGKAMRGVQFGGNLSIDGKMRFAGNSVPDSFVESRWSSTVNVVNGRLSIAGHEVKNLYGEFRAFGQKDTRVSTNFGTADFHSLMCKGVQVTGLHAPWRMDQNLLIIGAGAKSSTNGEAPNHLTATLFGGEAQADGVVSLAKDHSFRFNNVSLSNFNAAEIARDFGLTSKITGRGEARLSQLTGSGEGTHTLQGKGYIRLRNANLAKLPVMITLVNQIRSGSKSSDVFSSGDIDFTIQGPYMYLDRFDLHGESLSLKGKGWIGLDRRLNIVFHTILGGEKRWWPSMRQLASRTSQRLLQILVTGTIDDMEMTPEVLPGLGDFFPEQARRNGLPQRK